MKLWYEWDFVHAAVESQKAIEINPNSAEAHINYGWCLVFTGRYAEACEQAAIAYTIDPLSLMNHWFVGWIYFYSEQFEKMTEISRRSIELEPNFFGGHMMLGSVLCVEKQYTAARAELELAVKLNYSFMTLSTLGILAGDMKDEAWRKEIISEMETLGKTQPLSNFDLGQVYTFMGDYDRAAGFFEKAIELREGFLVLARDNIRVYGNQHLNPKIEEVLKKVAPLNEN
jgi:serine/threonine-protein kinase